MGYVLFVGLLLKSWKLPNGIWNLVLGIFEQLFLVKFPLTPEVP